ncbi:hypothetical protein FRC07_005978, partial [Ceratobasidium sp. 392]
VQISRISSRSEAFENMLEFPPGSNGTEGTSDSNPVVLPQITAEEFRNLLYLFYGSPLDYNYALFLRVDDWRSEREWPTNFQRYIDIAKLARRLCMAETEKWAQQKLQHIISTLKPGVGWLKYTDALSALSYFKLCDDAPSNDEYIRKARDLVYSAMNNRPNQSLVELYRSSAGIDRALSGLVFTRAVLAGHQSSVWDQFTLPEKAKLYAAQIHMKSLPTSAPFCHFDSVETVIAAVQQGAGAVPLCSVITGEFTKVWEELVTSLWGSTLSFEGVRGVWLLFLAREGISSRLKAAGSCPCPYNRQCLGPLVAKLDALIESLFVEVANIRDKLTA